MNNPEQFSDIEINKDFIDAIKDKSIIINTDQKLSHIIDIFNKKKQ